MTRQRPLRSAYTNAMKRILLPLSILTLLVSVLCCSSEAYSSRTDAFRPDRKFNWITDSANTLTPRQEDTLNRMLSDFNQRTTVQLVGFIIESLKGAPIEAYSLWLASELRPGLSGVNNGMMIVVVPSERRIRIISAGSGGGSSC